MEINRTHAFGKKFRDEHFEYEIEIKLGEDENWSIFRRYSKIRELHERMCVAYPSLSRLVFPMKWMFNSSEHNLVLRQMQLEAYLILFLEIMLVDPTSPICCVTPATTITRPTLAQSVSMNSMLLGRSGNGSLNLDLFETRVLTKAKLCSFCSFFEPTTSDLEYQSSSSNQRDLLLGKSRSSSITMSSLEESTDLIK